MNRKDLAKQLAIKTNSKADKAEKLILAIEHTIEKALEEGKKVVYSNFGTFYTVHYPSKIIYHPKLGKSKQMVMLPTNAAKWMPSANIKDLVNSDAEINDTLPLTAHGMRKFTHNLNPEPKFATYTKDKTAIKEKTDIPAVKSQDINNDVILSEAKNLGRHGDRSNIDPAFGLDPSPRNNGVQDDKLTDEEEVEIPIRAIKNTPIPIKDVAPPHVNIYEETDDDGSKVESTFKDAIRLHDDKKKGFFNRLFNKDDVKETKEKKPEEVVSSEKISLKGAGIFNNDAAVPLPDNAQKASPINTASISPKSNDNAEIETFRQAKTEPAIENKQDTLKSEIEITPFAGKENSPQVAYVDLSKTIVPKEILHLIPEKIARQYKVVPIEQTDKDLTVAMIDPQDLEAIEIIKKMSPKALHIKLSSEEDVNHILDQYSGLEKELSEAIKTADTEQEDQEKPELIDESTSDNAPAARIVTSLLRRAIRDKASDIHIEPEEKDVVVRFRQDGVLRKTVTLPKDLRSSVVSRIKIMANMKIDEQRLPQDGRFSIDVDKRKVDFRVSSMPVANGEKVVMRVLDKLTGILSIEELGITGGGLERLLNNLKKSHGMILVTGPTGSGKTTSLYALIDKLYTEGVNIVTLEDPIEYRMPGINQSQVNAEIKYTFASGLRSIVRQDPDIIMIGEIRDAETAEMAVHAALTGHIVLSTLHTNDAAGAAPRLLDMGVEPFLLTSSLNIVIAQRLARKICQDCKEELVVPEPEMEKVRAEIAKMPEAERPKEETLKFYHGKGCKNCNDSGYTSRIGLYEVLEISEPIKELILKKESSFKIQELATKAGMITMLGDGILKAIAGNTTLEEVWRITQE